jgi:hypothetical protein
MAFLCVSQQGDLKNTIKLFWGRPKKLREKILSYFFPPIFFISFFAVSLHEKLKNTTKIFFKTRQKNTKEISKEIGDR